MDKSQPVAVLYGGRSEEREVSLRSGEAVSRALSSRGWQVINIDPAHQSLAELQHQNVAKVFLALHGGQGEDGVIQGALEMMQMPYTGSGVLGSALGMDKVRSKFIWQQLGISTPEFEIIPKSSFNSEQAEGIIARFGGRVMVKPAREGSSIGMAQATNGTELEDALANAFVHDETALVEKWIEGPEYTVAILGDRTLPAVHMETPHSFYDYQAKYESNDTTYICPCELDEQQNDTLSKLAHQAFKALHCDGWGRVDVMADEQGRFYVLEVNTAPGMTTKSLVPMAAQAEGIDFAELCEQILLSASIKGM